MHFIDRVKKRIRSPELSALVDPAALAARLRALRDVGREDLSLARMIEGHLDAITIVSEAGHEVPPGVLYGIWASRGTCSLKLDGSGARATLHGTKPFCSGSDLVDRALVLVDEDQRLVDVDMRSHREWTVSEDAPWCTPAFAETRTWTLKFSGQPIETAGTMGKPGWYFQRRGFWVGALGPAACWAGGAIGLVDYARRYADQGPHARAGVGALMSAHWQLDALLAQAAAATERDTTQDAKRAYPRALAVRHGIERLCMDVVDRFARIAGPRALAGDAVASRRVAELMLYVRQCHGERDLEELGSQAGWWSPS